MGDTITEGFNERIGYLKKAITAEMGQRNYKWESKEIEVGRYRRGAITLHIVDAAKNHMLWTATLRGSLPDDSTKVAAFAQKGVQALFNKFPIQ